MRFRITVDGEVHDIEVEGLGPRLVIRVDGAEYRARVGRESAGSVVRIGPRRHHVVIRGSQVLVDGTAHRVETDSVESTGPASGVSGTGRAVALVEVRPPMPGRIVKLPLGVGATVKRGQILAVLEAMKMQNEIPSPADGTLRTLGVKEGESISGDRIIAVIETR